MALTIILIALIIAYYLHRAAKAYKTKPSYSHLLTRDNVSKMYEQYEHEKKIKREYQREYRRKKREAQGVGRSLEK